jgi:hypothetical protein
MNDITFIAQFVLVVAAATAPIVVVLRWLSGSDSMLDIPGQPLGELTWPRGVQEDEPRPWNFAARTSRDVASTATATPSRTATRAPLPA